MYDLTEKVLPFLDPKLASQVVFFNKEGRKQDLSATPVAAVLVDVSNPTLDVAHKLYECNQITECQEVLSRVQTVPGSFDAEVAAWARLACRLVSASAAPAPPTAQSLSAGSADDAAADDETVEAEKVEPERAEPERARDELLHDPVLKEVVGVREALEARRSLPGEQLLVKRAWLLHWSLFAYFSGTRLQYLPDRLFATMPMSVIQSACPWLLRYLSVAVVCLHSPTARFNRRVKDLVRVLQLESYEYKDAVTDLVLSLYADGDLDTLAQKLSEAHKLLKNDFFATELADEFVDKFRVLAADVYFKVHLTVERDSLVQALGINDNIDEWLQKYLSHKVDAKLDVSYDEASKIARVTYLKHSVPAYISDKVKHLDQKAKQIHQEI